MTKLYKITRSTKYVNACTIWKDVTCDINSVKGREVKVQSCYMQLKLLTA